MCYGLAALLIFILDIYVIYLIMTSSLEPGMKLVWVILVLLLPLLGPVLFLAIGRGPSVG
jgi:uncharacterized RDD family membrane protein YckC